MIGKASGETSGIVLIERDSEVGGGRNARPVAKQRRSPRQVAELYAELNEEHFEKGGNR
jgi:hypothetical protein